MFSRSNQIPVDEMKSLQILFSNKNSVSFRFISHYGCAAVAIVAFKACTQTHTHTDVYVCTYIHRNDRWTNSDTPFQDTDYRSHMHIFY